MPTKVQLFLKRAFSLWQSKGLWTRIAISLMAGIGLEWLIFPARGWYYYLSCWILVLFWILVPGGIVKLVRWSNTKECREFFANS